MERHLGVSWGPLGRSWGLLVFLGTSWPVFWGPLWPSWRPPSWAVLGLSREPLGSPWAFWEAPGAVLGCPKPRTLPLEAFFETLLMPSWGVMGTSWAVLKPSSADLGRLLHHRGRSEGHRGGSEGPPRATRAHRARLERPGGAGSVRPLALQARPVRCIAGEMTSGSSVASHISLSSAKARCHCSPFSHALIPAL